MMTVIPIAIAAPLIYLGVHYSTPGSPDNPTGAATLDESFYEQPKSVPFTRAKQRAVRKVLARFVETAVARHDVARAWNVAGPSLREGTTYRDWQKGDIPVVPYPAAKHGQGTWSYVQFSYPNRVGVEVLLFPKPGSGYSMATADAEIARGRDGHWRVDYWMINKFHGPPATARASSTPPPATKKAQAKKTAQPNETRKAAPPTTPKPLDRKWLLLPAALLSLVILVPLGVVTGVWIRNRRAEAAFKRSH